METKIIAIEYLAHHGVLCRCIASLTIYRLRQQKSHDQTSASMANV